MSGRYRRTSAQTFAEIKASGLLSNRRMQVYQILYHHGAMTGAQVAQVFKSKYGPTGHSENIRNRLTELRDMGCVVETGVVTCPISGRNVLQWQTNDEMPQKPPRKKTKKQKEAKHYNQGVKDCIDLVDDMFLRAQMLRLIRDE